MDAFGGGLSLWCWWGIRCEDDSKATYGREIMLLFLDNLLSLALALVCWWLAHQNSAGNEPLNRWIATGYGILALVVMWGVLFRNFAERYNFLDFISLTKTAATLGVLGLVAYRLYALYEKHDP